MILAKFTLIVISGLSTVAAPFQTEVACENARKEIIHSLRNNGYYIYHAQCHWTGI